jgi:DNA-binding CsgD family transcriptional regulator/tetratricopeptide (TPR) repeat protein
MEGKWPLVGRGMELERFLRAIENSNISGVVLAGAPGVGKTSCLRAALDRAEAAGFSTKWIVGSSSSTPIPLGPFAHLLPDHPADSLGRTNLLRWAADVVCGEAGDRRLVLGVDDAHLLDDLSAELVHHVAAVQGVFIVAAIRTGEPVPQPITDLWKNEIAERHELHPLSRGQVGQILTEVLGPNVEDGTVDALTRVSQGNALFLRELVHEGLELKSLAEINHVWAWRGRFATTPRLTELVETRLGNLGTEERDAAEVVAAADRIEAEILTSIASSATVEQLERRGVVEVLTEGRRMYVRLSHPLYTEVLRSRTPGVRARSIRRSLVEALERFQAGRREDLLRLATWRLEAGMAGEPHLMLRGARRAIAAFDFRLAERLARAALDGGGGRHALLTLSEALVGQGQFEDAETLLSEAADSTDDDEARTILAVVRSSNLFWHLARASQAEDLLLRTEGSVAHPQLRQDLSAARIPILMFGGRTEDAITTAIELFETPGVSPRALALAGPMVAWSLNIAGRSDEVLPLIEAAFEKAPQDIENSPFAPQWLESQRSGVLVFKGHLDAAAIEIGKIYRGMSEENDPSAALLAFALSWVSKLQGRVREAVKWLLESQSWLLDCDVYNVRSAVQGDMAHCHALLGQLDLAEAALEESLSARVDSFKMDEVHIGMGRAWRAVAKGEISAGTEIAFETAKSVGAMGQRWHEAAALHDVARLGSPERVATRLSELAEVVDGDLVPAYADHAEALVKKNGPRLERVSDRFEELGAHLFAAEAAAQASIVHRGSGRMGSAQAAAARSGVLAGRCEGARTPALLESDLAVPLTRREWEIATLAAHGLSNQEIAHRLVVSVRTVDNHLHHVYTKTGVSGRAKLRWVLGLTHDGNARLRAG